MIILCTFCGNFWSALRFISSTVPLILNMSQIFAFKVNPSFETVFGPVIVP